MLYKKIGIALVLSLVLSGCDNKELEEAQKQISVLTEERDSLSLQLQDMSEQLTSLQGIDTETTTSITSYSTVANVNTVEDVSAKIQVDGLLEYSGSFQAPNTASINLLETATIIPSSNWSVRIDGTTSYYSHPSGVNGVIKMSNITNEVDEIYYQSDFIDPFLKALPSDGVKTTRIYVDTKYAGLSTETAITQNENPAILKFGVFGRGTTSCVYCFYYDGKKDVTKSELIDGLIKSMTIEKRGVRVE